MLGYLNGKRFGSKKKPKPIGRRVTGYRRIQVVKQAMEGNNQHAGHRCICEGDTAHVGVSHGIVEVKLLCFRGLSPFLKLV